MNYQRSVFLVYFWINIIYFLQFSLWLLCLQLLLQLFLFFLVLHKVKAYLHYNFLVHELVKKNMYDKRKECIHDLRVEYLIKIFWQRNVLKNKLYFNCYLNQNICRKNVRYCRSVFMYYSFSSILISTHLIPVLFLHEKNYKRHSSRAFFK